MNYLRLRVRQQAMLLQKTSGRLEWSIPLASKLDYAPGDIYEVPCPVGAQVTSEKNVVDGGGRETQVG